MYLPCEFFFCIEDPNDIFRKRLPEMEIFFFNFEIFNISLK